MYQRVTGMTPEQRVQGGPVSDPALHERRLGRHRRPVPATEVVQNHDRVPAGEKLGDHDAADVPRRADAFDARTSRYTVRTPSPASSWSTRSTSARPIPWRRCVGATPRLRISPSSAALCATT